MWVGVTYNHYQAVYQSCLWSTSLVRCDESENSIVNGLSVRRETRTLGLTGSECGSAIARYDQDYRMKDTGL